MKKIAVIGIGLSTCLGLPFFGLSALLKTESSVSFQSLESKTETGGAVFNRVKLIAGKAEDVWLMQQNQNGSHSEFDTSDKLAIVVDKAKKTAQFYQLNSGSLTWTGRQDAIGLKARCFACHSNGPRALRPDPNGQLALSFQEKLLTQAWNLRIKLYGRLESLQGFNTEDGIAFRSGIPFLATALNQKTCVRCHSENGIRQPLLQEHFQTAKFLVEKGEMPPFPFSR